MHYCVGGNSKFWGAVLFRMREEDFGEIEHADGVSPAWPIDYATLAPYYARAEQCYLVHGASGSDPTEPPRDAYPFPAVPHDPHIEPLIERLRGMGLHPSPLPLGLSSPGTHCVLCTTCNSFPCYIDAKSEAEQCGVRPATALGAVRVLTGARAQRLLTDPSGRQVTAVEVERNGGDRAVCRRRSSSSRAAPSTRPRCCCARRTTGTPTASATRRNWWAAATWRTWRR